MCDSLLVFLATVFVEMLAMPLSAIDRLDQNLLEGCFGEVLDSVPTLCMRGLRVIRVEVWLSTW